VSGFFIGCRMIRRETMVTDEEVEAVLREHIRVDATGLAPAVVGHMVFGFADAAKAVRALLAAEAARKPDAAWRADHEYQWTTGRDEWQRRENERLAAWRPSGPDVVPGLERAREIVQSMFCDSEDGEAARDEAVADISAEIAKHRPSPSPEHPVDDDALVRRLDGLPQP
jgi:hypothetical protein